MRLERIRKSKIAKGLAIYICVSMLGQLFWPNMTFALTSGPAQEEYASFEPISTNNMVDPYSGDFTYNMPLLSVPGPNGGYPINMAYHSGINVEQEASWVGLGWNINVGAINRGLRGLPDDFNGESVKQYVNMRDSRSASVDLWINKDRQELFGFPYEPSGPPPSPEFTWQIHYNNYKGLGYRSNLNLPIKTIGPISANLGLTFDSQGGLNFQPGLTVGGNIGSIDLKMQANANINSRHGLSAVNVSSQVGGGKANKAAQASTASANQRLKKRDGSFSGVSALSFQLGDNRSQQGIPMSSNHLGFKLDFAIGYFGDVPTPASGLVNYDKPMNGAVDVSSINYTDAANQLLSNTAYGYLNNQNASVKSLMDFQEGNFLQTKKIPNLAPSNLTYDAYIVSGQGAGGNFRPYRSEVGNYRKPEVESITKNSFDNGVPVPGLEFGKGSGSEFHIGVDVNLLESSATEYSGRWKSGATTNNFLSSITDYPEYEPYYFQMYGEPTVVYDNTDANHNEDQLEYWKNDTPLRAQITKNTAGDRKDDYYQTSGTFESASTGTAITLSNPSAADVAYLSERRRRSTNIFGLNWDDAAAFGRSRGVQIYDNDYVRTNLAPLSSDYTDKFDGATETFYPSKGTIGGKDSQLSEINVLQANGMTYTYGVAALNKIQRDASFRVNGDLDDYRVVSEPSSGSNLVKTDNISRLKASEWTDGASKLEGINIESGAVGTDFGLDEYVSVTEKPAYAHSWLLTQATSSDYVDADDIPGPSDGDLGYWVKFNYKVIQDYKWRIPFTDANNSPGSLSNKLDNLGTYSYGEKDVYFLESIETKTHIAIFSTSARKDGHDSKEILGEADLTGAYYLHAERKRMQKLDHISLYAKSDIDEAGSVIAAKAIKEVHMSYNYDLCQGIPSNSGSAILNSNESSNLGGKLTLEKVHFTYNGYSGRGELSPYTFDYDATDDYKNPSYNFRNIDRWGCYKPNFDSEFSTATPSNNFVGDQYPFTQIPYVDQYRDFNHDNVTTGTDDIDQRNAFASAWHLREIGMPSGGTMKVEYESDDYAYVEDQKAMQMVDVVHVGASLPGTIPSRTDNSITTAVNDLKQSNKDEKVWFKLEDELSYKSDLFDDYLSNLTDVYFKANVNLRDGDEPVSEYEFVEGYAQFIATSGNWGLENADGTASNYGWIKLEPEKTKKHGVVTTHPFRLAAINYKRQNRPELIFGGPGTAGGNVISLVSMIPDAMKIIAGGFVNSQIIQFQCDEIQYNGRTVMRLNSPDAKFGGGCRVKKLYVEENIFGDEMPSGYTTNQYGQVYSYQMEDGTTSGVAYEPVMGQEESALIQPIDYGDGIPFKSEVTHFIEKPVLKNYYPGQSVGYRRVVVSSIARENMTYDETNEDDKMSHKSATPVVEHTFYSPFDFPVYTQETDMTSDPAIVRFMMIPGFMTRFNKRKARSQGYSVVLNDMAGRLKKVKTYIPKDPNESTETDRILSESEYVYQTTAFPGKPGKFRLDNAVSVLDDAGNCADAIIGQTHDIFVTSNENKSESNSLELQFNLEGIFSTPLPPVVPIPLPVSAESELSFKTIVTHKIIHQSGVLKTVVARDKESVIKTHNLIYDGATGQPIYTSVENEFEDDIYSFSQPGHMVYDGLQAAYQNQNLTLGGVDYAGTTTGLLTLPTLGTSSYHEKFTPGDELWVWEDDGVADKYATGEKLTVLSKSGTHGLIVIDENGDKFDPAAGDYNIQVIRSGHRNMQSAIIGSMASLDDWREEVNCNFNFAGRTQLTRNVLNASAITMEEGWKTDCTPALETAISAGTAINPYKLGMAGIWRASDSYVYVKDRTNTDDIRIDGDFEMTKSFPWDVGINVGNEDNWELSSSVTKYSSKGFELENKDAIGVYSAAQYGYGDALVTAISGDARYHEISFDGFEDYDYYLSNTDDHWDFGIVAGDLVTTEAHSGEYSFKLASSTNRMISADVAPDCSSTSNYDINSEDITLNACGCNGEFTPIVDSTYYVSMWVKETVAAGTYTLNYTDPEFVVDVKNGGGLIQSYSFDPSGAVIDGWQQIRGKFTVNTGATFVELTLKNAGTDNIYMDDIRVHPLKSSFQSYVYNWGNLKPVAVLDNNNYATFYAYDDEGRLIKTSKETIEGIKTISEGRTGDKKNP